MSKFYEGMKGKDRDTIAVKYNIPDGGLFKSWLRALNYLRNLCAHHCRLWNRNMVDQPRLPAASDAGELASFICQPQLNARPFLHLCLLQWLMRQICPNSHWNERLCEHLNHFPEDTNKHHSLSEMGCPADWQKWNLWN